MAQPKANIILFVDVYVSDFFFDDVMQSSALRSFVENAFEFCAHNQTNCQLSIF